MLYKEFKNLKLSMLGLGTMRLPLKGENPSDIDEDKTRDMVAYAIENGINYFDTAWGYHNGQSEIVIGKAVDDFNTRERRFGGNKK